MARFTYDAVVVGAGPAGVSAALTMARQGLKVIIIERGRFAGAKNLSGGTLYTHALLELLPDLWDREPPLERPVTEHGFWFFSKGAMTRFTHRSEQLEGHPVGARRDGEHVPPQAAGGRRLTVRISKGWEPQGKMYRFSFS